MFSTIYIVIVSHNGSEAVLRLLDSVYASSYKNYAVILVDNNSKDRTIQSVEQKFPACEIIAGKSNLGYGQACNIGFQRAIENNAEFLLILNQDTIIHEDMILKVIISAMGKPCAGIIGPKTYFYKAAVNGCQRILYSGAWSRILPLAQYVNGMGRCDNGQYDTPVKVDYVWGHGMLIRASALKKVGLFDPDFFMYYEDLDLCIRMKRAGYEIWYEPTATMWHDVPDGARASKSEFWRWIYKSESVSIFHRKHYGRIMGRLFDFVTMIAEVLALAKSGYVRAMGHRVYAWVIIAFNIRNR